METKKRKMLIFGAAGFIGSHFKRYLEDTSDSIIVKLFDINKDENKNNAIIKCDVREPIHIQEEYNPDDIIINLAAIHRMPGHKDYEYFETNIRGAENICQFADEKGINNIIFTSSIAPYGAGEDLKEESTLPTPNTPYGISKLVAENIHRTWQAQDQSRKLLIIRPGVVFGKGEKGNNTRLYNALKKGRFFYPGRKDTIKANFYVKDLVALSLKIFKSYDQGTKTFNFAHEPGYTIKEIVDTMCEVCSLRQPRLVVNGNLLKMIASIVNLISRGKLGIHPERIEKLMKSTNISGQKLLDSDFRTNYDLKTSIEDWYRDCNSEGLF